MYSVIRTLSFGAKLDSSESEISYEELHDSGRPVIFFCAPQDRWGMKLASGKDRLLQKATEYNLSVGLDKVIQRASWFYGTVDVDQTRLIDLAQYSGALMVPFSMTPSSSFRFAGIEIPSPRSQVRYAFGRPIELSADDSAKGTQLNLQKCFLSVVHLRQRLKSGVRTRANSNVCSFPIRA